MVRWVDRCGDLEPTDDLETFEMATTLNRGGKAATATVADAPTAPEPDARDVNVRHSDLFRWSDCATCGATTATPGWRVCRGVKPLCPPCEAAFPTHVKLAAQLNESCPKPTWHQARFAIFPTAAIPYRICPGCFDHANPKSWAECEVRGEFEVASVSEFSGRERLVCEDCAVGRFAEATEPVRETLDRHYGRKRALRPPPAPPPEPTAQELAERDRKAREDRAIISAARAIFPIGNENPVTKSQAAAARHLLEAVEVWLASRPTKESK
jgi:hypothetical protein